MVYVPAQELRPRQHEVGVAHLDLLDDLVLVAVVAQADLVLELGVDLAQGYFVGRPSRRPKILIILVLQNLLPPMNPSPPMILLSLMSLSLKKAQKLWRHKVMQQGQSTIALCIERRI